MPNKLNSKAEENASKLIDQGKVDEASPWEMTPEDENELLGDPPDWEKYSLWFLGIDPEANEEAKAKYKYPHGKQGKVYRSALRAIRGRAGQQGDTEIADAAGRLLDQIDAQKAQSDKAARISYPQIAARLFDLPLLVSRAKLDVLLAALGPRLGISAEFAPTDLLAASPSYDGPTLTDAGVAVIPVCGTIVHRALAVGDAPSGLTSYQAIRRDFDAAIENPAVRAIVFDVDSHGGEVAGAFDFVDHVFASRGKKPIYALVDEAALSAGYAIASAADRIYIPRTGNIGSIGICAVHVDQSKANEQAGLKVTTVYAGDRKNDLNPNEPLSEGALAALKADVDRAYELFVATVARNRGVSADAVRATEAGIFTGEAAVAAGLADAVSPVDAALAEIGTLASRSPLAATSFRGGAEVIDFEKAKAELEAGTRKRLESEWSAREKELRTRLEAVRRVDLFADLAPIVREQGIAAAADRLCQVLAAASGPEISTLVDPMARAMGIKAAASPAEIYARRREMVAQARGERR